MVQPYLTQSSHASIDYKRLLRWLVHMQGAESELGGFRGRTNKLVDGCYSWWVGGCFALLASLGVGGTCTDGAADVDNHPTAHEEWNDADGAFLAASWTGTLMKLESLWNKAALQRYILCAAQHPAAGLRDKPPK